jgi:prevent-host-death family protein
MTSSVSALKAHLSENLRRVAHGETLVVTDRRKPVARIIPYEMDDLVEKMPSMPFTPAPVKIGEFPAINSLSLLLAERGEL